ncbi:MAG TPA: prepilin-type N-terminal cleavage/methylation domain-containing protein [Gemmatimonadaceae bacterium]|nr:prepilin-type N-terminal cleavage/methylation domain-containing protein [Gemmatimonadaceae bacterium]
MSTGRRFSHRARRGFTLIELIVGLVIGLVVLGSVVQMMIVQGRGYRKQREIIDIRETAREAAALLTWDLRQSGLGGSVPTVIGASTVTLRSPRSVGTVCAKHATLARYGLWKSGGNILASVDDSALVYQIGRDKWTALKITAVGTPAAMGVTTCAWPGSRPPDVVVELGVTTKTYTSYIKIGAPFRRLLLHSLRAKSRRLRARCGRFLRRRGGIHLLRQRRGPISLRRRAGAPAVVQDRGPARLVGAAPGELTGSLNSGITRCSFSKGGRRAFALCFPRSFPGR